jgi:tetratricopeptide (TPR) repeat protein
VLLVGTYRHVGARANSALDSALAELAREPTAAASITLEGLSHEEVGTLLAIRLGSEPGAEVISEVCARTDGNPFFVRELMQLRGRGEVSAVPRSLQAAVRQRVAELSDAAQEALEVAAVIGRDVPQGLLARAQGVPEELLLDPLEEAVRAGVLVEQPTPARGHRFTHAVLQETLYAAVARSRRVHLHRRVGEALEALHASDLEPHLTALAHHFCQALPSGDSEKAIEYSVRVADQAMSHFAFEEAASHYARAVELLDASGGPDDRWTCALLLSLAAAQDSAAQPVETGQTLTRCLRLARSLRDPDLIARTASSISRMGVYPDSGRPRVQEEALAALGAEDSLAKVELLSAFADYHYFRDRAATRRLSSEAVAIARRLGDPCAVTLSLSLPHALAQPEDRRDARYAISEEMMDLATRSGDDRALYFALRHRLLDLLVMADCARFDRHLSQLRDVAERMGLPVLIGARLARSARALWRGEFAEAEAIIQGLLTLARRRQAENFALMGLAQLFDLRRHQGRLAEVAGALPGVSGTPQAAQAILALAALLQVVRGAEAESRAAFEQLAGDDFEGLDRGVTFPLDLALLSETCVRLSDSRRAEPLYRILVPWSGCVLAHGGPGVTLSVGAAGRYLGLLATLLERFDDAESHFEEALAMERRMGARTWEAYVRLDYARMLLRRDARGDRTAARSQLRAASALVKQLGLDGLTEQINASWAQLGNVVPLTRRRRRSGSGSARGAS